MSVKNNFPNIDRVIGKLRDYVRFFEEKKGKEIDEDEANECLDEVDAFIEALENYLDSVCNDEKKIEQFKAKRDSREEIQEYIGLLYDDRTRYHSDIIRQMVMIDRMAQAYGLNKVFDYAEEFEKDTAPLLANNWEDKKDMDTRAREKRREMGNFGLYIAAGVTVGLEMSDKELRDFSSCDVETVKEKDEISVSDAYNRVKSQYRKNSVKKNMEDMLI